MKKRTLPVRATPPSPQCLEGMPAAVLDAYYPREADDLLLRIGLVARRTEDEEERDGLKREMEALHAILHFFGPDDEGRASVTVLTESVAREKRRSWGEKVEDVPVTGHGSFQIPAKALPQTALFGEPEVRPPSGPLRMPYRDSDERDLEPAPSEERGRFFGAEATETERASGLAVEEDDLGPLKPGSAAHSVLRVYGDGERRTAYEASRLACGDFHARRRESTRLLTRGFLAKSGTLPNPAPGGRDHVDAYAVTERGRDELVRLNSTEEAMT